MTMMASPATQWAALDAALQLSQNALTMQRALRYYNGNPPDQLSRRLNERDPNVKVGLGRLIVDVGTAYLFGQDCPSQVQGANSAPKQDWLDLCWEPNNKRGLTLMKLATNAGICGHVFVRLLDTKPWPRAVVIDPSTVDVVLDPDDCDCVWRYIITPPPVPPVDEDEPEMRRRTIIENQCGTAGYRVELPSGEDHWTITDQQLAGTGGDWQTTASAVWPYPWSPIVDAQNLPAANSYWGVADLTDDVLHVIDVINKTASHMNKLFSYFAHPLVYGYGLGGNRPIDRAVDAIAWLPSETARLEALDVGHDQASALSYLDRLLDYLSMMTRIPAVCMGKPDSLGPASGTALKVRWGPLEQKVETKRRTLGGLVQQIDARLLCLGGFGPIEQHETKIQWPLIVPQDDLAERQVAELDLAMGLCSKRTVAARFNIDFEAEVKELAKEKALEPPPPPPPLGLVAPVPDISKSAPEDK